MSEREVYDVVDEHGPLTHSEIHAKLPHFSTAGVDRALEPMVERDELDWEKKKMAGGTDILYDTKHD